MKDEITTPALLQFLRDTRDIDITNYKRQMDVCRRSGAENSEDCTKQNQNLVIQCSLSYLLRNASLHQPEPDRAVVITALPTKMWLQKILRIKN